MKTVSVVIPAYNVGTYLVEAIKSVLAQTYKDYEVIVINDGSTDETVRLLKPYANRINYIYQANKGPARARNIGIKASKGKYIAFLDADDIWLPEKLALQVQLMENYPEIDLVFSDLAPINRNDSTPSFLAEKKRRTMLSAIPSYKVEYGGIIFSRSPFLKLLRCDFIITSTVLVKKIKVELIGGVDESLRPDGDYDLWLRLAISSVFAYFPQVLCLKRVREGSITSQILSLEQGGIQLFKKMRKISTSLGYEAQRIISKRLAESYFGAGYCFFKKEKFRLARKHFWQSIKESYTFRAFFYFSGTFFPPDYVKTLRGIKKQILK